MSSKTNTSILTDAMQRAQAAEKETTTPTEESNDTITITINKKAIKKALFGTALGVGVTYLATRLLGSSSGEDEETTTED